MEKWYVGLTANDIVVELSRIAHNTVAHYKQGEEKESEKLEKEFDKKFDSVIPAIVDIKTAYYMHNKTVYNEWDKCQQDLWTIKISMQRNLDYSV